MLDEGKPIPPKPTPRKDNPINAEYEQKAQKMIRNAMRDGGVAVAELAERLNAIGVEISSGGMANKISRGGFSAAFLLQCLEVLGASAGNEENHRDQTL
ncbi:MAG: GMP synthase [Paracoccaceae bacterium]